MTAGELEKEKLDDAVDKLVQENQEGFEKLANEELAEQRRNESVVSRIWREIKRKLGLRKSGAKTIELQ